jgi:hypothetical protein
MMHKSLLIEFSKALGFESLPNDCFALSVDNKFDINVGYQEESEEIIFVSYIAPLANTQDDTNNFMKDMLLANYANDLSFCSGSLGLCPEGKHIVFSVKAAIRELDLPELLKIFDHIICISQQWYDKSIGQVNDSASSPLIENPTMISYA